MQFVDEFRDPVLAKSLLNQIAQVAGQIVRPENQPLQIMEVCGGHTHAIFRYGIEQLLPENIELVHGPGCPVCVLPKGRVDDCIVIAEQPDVILATFGDAMRVLGSRQSLLQARAEGCDIRVVYSPLDALALAQANPDKRVVFFGLGFETTMPSTALTLQQAEREGVRNFFLFSNHITIIPTLRAMLEAPDMNVDAFLGPGHVSMIIGEAPYAFIARDFKRPLVISGFEPIDILYSLLMVLRQLEQGQARIENQYTRVVNKAGNLAALTALDAVFELREHFEWRGLGSIDQSGVRITERYARFDAEREFALPNLSVVDPAECQCGEVLQGRLKPRECRLFGQSCTPENPMGALMVSSEGTCAAYYKYGGSELIAVG